jgi:hypothetical protein
LSGRVVSNYVGLIVLALLAGLLVPLAVAAYVAVRDPLPPSCHTGLASSTSLDGAITWTNGPTLWYADGDLGRARRLVSYAPARSQLPASPGASPSPSGAAPTSPSPVPPSPALSPSAGAPASPGASPSPAIPATNIEAAAITPDHALVAFLVSNPPDNPGYISLRTISPQAPPRTAPAVGYSTAWHPELGQRSEVLAIAPNRILFMIPARYDPPETSQRVVGVVEVTDSPKLVEGASENDFVTKQHSLWPETKDYKLPPPLPGLRYRVIGPEGAAAGEDDLVIRTPLTRRTLHAIRVGRGGSAATTVVCATADTVTPAALSPDERRLALVAGDSSYILDLGGGRGLAFLTAGRVLDWRS